MIGERFNFEDVFFRDLTACVLDTLEGQVKWTNRFTSGDKFVQVPFYYSLTGDERFLLDTFADDIVSENRFIELNTDSIPRGHLTMTGFNIKSDEFANPNVWLRMVVENEVEIKRVLAKVRAVPISVNYDLEILLANEIDTFKCSQAIMDTLWLYKFMYFEHNFMNIDAVILMPDTNSIEMVREKNLTSDNTIKLKASFEVQTYYPAFRKDRIGFPGYTRKTGDGMTDADGYTSFPNQNQNSENFTPTGGNQFNFTGSGGPGGASITGNNLNLNTPSTPFGPQGSQNVSQFGETFSFFSSAGSVGAPDPLGSSARLFFNDPDYFIVSPKRTKWFNNILKAREGNNFFPRTNSDNIDRR